MKDFQIVNVQKDFGSYTLEIVQKKIKNIYFRIYPSKERIVISVPVHLDEKTLNNAILSKKEWILKQIQRGGIAAKPDLIKTYTTGEDILFKGQTFCLRVNHLTFRSRVCVADDYNIDLFIKSQTNFHDRERIINTWYRKELKKSIGRLVDKWQDILGVTVNEFGVRKMKTRWGSCNINAKRIWLNLALIKLARPFLEYVVVHEMVHLLERKHNARFKGFMDQFIPDWRTLKKELDQCSL
jgi:predicted metal-dependent hydrolase